MAIHLVSSKFAIFTAILLCLNLSAARVDTSQSLLRSLQSSCYPEVASIKVLSTTGEPLQFFELQALSLGSNVALNKNATLSSTHKGFVAANAVDGNEVTFVHSLSTDANTWFNVDLGGTFSIEFVKIKNRFCIEPSDPNNCLCRLSNAQVLLMNAQGGVIQTESIGDTCGVHDVNIDLSSCSQPVSSESVPSITISSAIVDEDNSFSVSFSNPLDDTSIFAAVIDNLECSTENSSVHVDSNTQNVATGTSTVTVTQAFNDLITAEQKNSGSVKLNFCLRADVWHANFPSSLIASKVSVGITITFDQNNSFTVDMQASDFTASYAGYTSERGVDVSAALGECSSPGNQGPYALGSTLKFCVTSTLSDVVVSGLKDVSFTDSDGNAILGIVDNTGEPSFVTTVAGLNSKSVDISTMMATTIYDQGFGGSTINVQGAVAVSYVNTGRRLLKQVEQNKPFALSVVVAGNKDSGTAKSNAMDPEDIGSESYVMFGVIPLVLVGGLAFVLTRAR